MTLILLAAVIGAATLGSVCFAQTSPPSSILPAPEAGVRGTGAIPAYRGVGTFDVNVWRAGSTLYGGFRYTETTTDSRRTVNIVSKSITDMVIQGNYATVRAIGTWDNMPATLIIETLDDNPSGDWFRIVAIPQGPMTVIFQRSGGVIKGDLTVYAIPVKPPDLYAKGDGMIALSNTCYGRFQFGASRIKGVTDGSLTYSEITPVFASTAIRPVAHIILPKVEKLDVQGNTAVFAGKGTFNGRPALIEVRVTDNRTDGSLVAIPDQFSIRAVPATPTSIGPMVYYEAGGPLRAGDLVVKTVPVR